MSKIIEKLPRILSLLLVLVSIVLVTLIYVGGQGDSIDYSGELLPIPIGTDALLYWTYALMILTVFVTIFGAIMNFSKAIYDHPKAAFKSLIPIALFFSIFIISWFLGSGEKMSIIGYDGTENAGFWAQFSDMMIYSIYFLFAAIGITILCSRIYIRYK